MTDQGEEPDPFEIPINGALDLHTFQPKDVRGLLPDYLEECMKRGIFNVRVIHGKGTGMLRETVHSILGRLSYVESYRLAGEEAGGWGATIVTMRQADPGK
ncbi:MAG: Smr/MutS family protein [Nitrospiraceae bacterium]|nr:Smr/MutS family protein [Nitrospiraceae bacterium]